MATLQSPSYSDRYFGHKDVAMNAALWGELQSHIDLAIIYVKLPLAPFFRLRQVCKEWNRLASDRQFLERTFKPPAADPFFVVLTEMWGGRLFTSQASSWSSMPVPRARCEVSGLLYLLPRQSQSDRIRIFDLHTRVFHAVPPVPTTMIQDPDEGMYRPVVGMTVDTTLIPHSFRVILGHIVVGTRIYDSKSGAWTQTSSTYEDSLYANWWPSCVNDNQFLYILYIKVLGGGTGTTFDLHAYDLHKDKWNFESLNVFEVHQQEFRDIGLWRERLFVFGLKFGPVVVVWEIDHRPEEPWTLFDSMPGEVLAWIWSGNDSDLNYIQSKFCNEHVLVYNCMGHEEKAVLYNLDQKTWEKVLLPIIPSHLMKTPALLNNCYGSIGDIGRTKEQSVHSMLFSPR